MFEQNSLVDTASVKPQFTELMNKVKSQFVFDESVFDRAWDLLVRSFSWYSGCPAIALFFAKDGRVAIGSMIESSAYNPTINPLQVRPSAMACRVDGARRLSRPEHSLLRPGGVGAHREARLPFHVPRPPAGAAPVSTPTRRRYGGEGAQSPNLHTVAFLLQQTRQQNTITHLTLHREQIVKHILLPSRSWGRCSGCRLWHLREIHEGERILSRSWGWSSRRLIGTGAWRRSFKTPVIFVRLAGRLLGGFARRGLIVVK